MGYCKEKSFLSLQSSEVLTDKVNKAESKAVNPG